jgi:hypothetical protein
VTEAIIITAIIVGGIVALAWILLHFAFKAWKVDQSQVASDGSIQIQVSGDLDPEAAYQVARERRYFDVN